MSRTSTLPRPRVFHPRFLDIPSRRRRSLRAELLEDRRLLAADLVNAAERVPLELIANGDEGPKTYFQASEVPECERDYSSPPPSFGLLVGGANPLTSLPHLSSRPGSGVPVAVYLDFNGHTEATWRSTTGEYLNVWTPAFDTDNDTSTFSDNELQDIREVWKGVSEAFSPFNINVSTWQGFDDQEYGNVIRVVIGGDGNWYGSGGGVASKAGTSNQLGKGVGSAFDLAYFTNTVFVWDGQGSGTGWANTTYISDAAVHEAGHAFGLVHQRKFIDGVLVDEYRDPDPVTGIGPFMGGSATGDIPRWSNGQVDASETEDNLAVLTSNNNFAFRSDDHGDSRSSATALWSSYYTSSKTGIIETHVDDDTSSSRPSRIEPGSNSTSLRSQCWMHESSCKKVMERP